MTPFEITITILAVLIVLLMGFIAYRVTTIWDVNNFIHIEIKKLLNDIKDDILDDRQDVCALLRIISDTLDNMHKNINLVNRFSVDWDKLSKEQQDEFLKRLICPNYDSPFQPPFNPTCETTNNDK